MKVTITTPFARLAVEMDAMKAATLLTEALIAAVPEPEENTEERPAYGTYADLFKDRPDPYNTAPIQPEEPSEPELPAEEDPAPNPIIKTPDAPTEVFQDDIGFDIDMDERVGFSANEETPEKGYRGLMHIKCDHCHKEKSFHIKWPLNEYRCECGHTMPLRGLSKVAAKCDCGWNLKYFTNQDADSFEIKCISCGDPVLVKWDFRHKRYENT